MGTDIEKLVDLMIQERMQSQFAKWREAETDKEQKAYAPCTGWASKMASVSGSL